MQLQEVGWKQPRFVYSMSLSTPLPPSSVLLAAVLVVTLPCFVLGTLPANVGPTVYTPGDAAVSAEIPLLRNTTYATLTIGPCHLVQATDTLG